MMDKIYIENLHVPTLIGVYDFEREAPQRLTFQVTLHVDTRAAGKSDKVADTVDYAQVCKLITDICQHSQYQLLEALGAEICQQVLARFAVSQICLRINKPDIMPDDINVAVELTRSS